jgi:hypothetical protein
MTPQITPAQISSPNPPRKPFRIPVRHSGNKLPSWRGQLAARDRPPVTLPLVAWLQKPIPFPEIDSLKYLKRRVP